MEAIRVYIPVSTAAGGTNAQLSLLNNDILTSCLIVDPANYNGTISAMYYCVRVLFHSRTNTGTMYFDLLNSGSTIIHRATEVVTSVQWNGSQTINYAITSIPSSVETYSLKYSGITTEAGVIINHAYFVLYVTDATAITKAESFFPIAGWNVAGYYGTRPGTNWANVIASNRLFRYDSSIFPTNVTAKLRAVAKASSSMYPVTVALLNKQKQTIASVQTTSTSWTPIETSDFYSSLSSGDTYYIFAGTNDNTKYPAGLQGAQIRFLQQEMGGGALQKFVHWAAEQKQFYEIGQGGLGRIYGSEQITYTNWVRHCAGTSYLLSGVGMHKNGSLLSNSTVTGLNSFNTSRFISSGVSGSLTADSSYTNWFTVTEGSNSYYSVWSGNEGSYSYGFSDHYSEHYLFKSAAGTRQRRIFVM